MWLLIIVESTEVLIFQSFRGLKKSWQYLWRAASFRGMGYWGCSCNQPQDLCHCLPPCITRPALAPVLVHRHSGHDTTEKDSFRLHCLPRAAHNVVTLVHNTHITCLVVYEFSHNTNSHIRAIAMHSRQYKCNLTGSYHQRCTMGFAMCC